MNRYINFLRLLTLNYKQIGLTDDEFVLLSITHELIQTGNKFVNPSDLALLCNFSTTKIDVVFSQLISKGLISNEFDDKGAVYTSFDGLYEKLLGCLNLNKGKENKKSKMETKDVMEYMQAYFNRPLSPLEYDVIVSWKNKKYDFELIKGSCEIANQTGNKSIRYIDTIIFEENKKQLLGSEEYSKQNQETIELSTVDWLNK